MGRVLAYAEDPVVVGMTEEGVVRQSDDALWRAESLMQGIRKVKDADDTALSWETTFGAFDAMVEAIEEAVCLPQLLSVVHPDAAVRKAAMTCEPKVDAFISQMYLDDDVAGVLRRAADLGVATSPTQKKLAGEVLREFRRNGLELPSEERERLRALNEKITALGQTFEVTLAETTLPFEVEPSQLQGLPESYIANHPVQDNGKVRLTTDYPDFVPFVRYAEDRAAARALYTLSENRGAEINIPTLRQLLALRREKANLLGYATWADYVLETRMAKNVATVRSFIEQLHNGLIARREEETAELEAMQRRLIPDVPDKVSVADVRYLEDKVRQERFALDSQKLSQYFEFDRVLQGVMDTAARLYGVRFEQVDAPVWHADVRAFDVKEGALTIGRAYLDLFPREGKYKHAAMFGIRDTKRLRDGRRQMPIASLVCNFPKPGASPALLSHDEVVVFFHEFGHLLHHLLSESEFVSFAGTNVARDFVEAPSQLFEAWAWDRTSLDGFARHFATGAALPDDLFTAMHEARAFGQAIATERQLFLAAYDFTCHVREPGFDPEELVKEIYPIYSSFERVPDTHFPTAFGHLVGYSAAYYSYQWSLAIAFDLQTRFEKEGMLNAQTAAEYRKHILAPGSSDDEIRLVERFLGRSTTHDAYLRHLGITL